MYQLISILLTEKIILVAENKLFTWFWVYSHLDIMQLLAAILLINI